MRSGRNGRRRRRMAWFWQWAALAGVVFIAVCVLAVIYVRNADAEYRHGERRAIELARTEADLAEADQVVFYTWDESLWIVIGKNREGTPIIVWERESGVESMPLAEGHTEEEILERFRRDKPDARLVRVLPGWFNGMPVWEIRYMPVPGTKEQALDFYSFRTGQHLKTYTLLGE